MNDKNKDISEILEDFKSKNKGQYYFLTRYGHKSPSTIDFRKTDKDIYLIFGAESTGIAYDILKDNGRVSHKQAVEKAYQEYDIFNKTQPIESDFDKIVKGLEKKE